MNRPLVNEYIELFKEVYNINYSKCEFDKFYKPLKEFIESMTDELLIRKISKLKEWAIQKGRI